MKERFTKPDWVADLPFSRMVYPESAFKKLKYAFWRFFAPLHPYLRDIGLYLGVIWHESGRQNFHLGYVAPHLSLRAFAEHLVGKGYGNHFIAWIDEEEVLSLRKVESFEYQYHLRVYSDGEVRGHYECTPECYPIWHMQESGMEPGHEHFFEILEDPVHLVKRN